MNRSVSRYWYSISVTAGNRIQRLLVFLFAFNLNGIRTSFKCPEYWVRKSIDESNPHLTNISLFSILSPSIVSIFFFVNTSYPSVGDGTYVLFIRFVLKTIHKYIQIKCLGTALLCMCVDKKH